MAPPSKKPKATSKKSTTQEVVDMTIGGETANILAVNGKKIYAQNGSKFFCLLDKKGLGNTDSGVCDFITNKPKQMAEHISCQHREDSLILRKYIKTNLNPNIVRIFQNLIRNQKFRCTNKDCKFSSKCQSALYKHICNIHKEGPYMITAQIFI